MTGRERPRADVLIANAAELLTMTGDEPDPIGRVVGGSVVIAGERILVAGPADHVTAAVDTTAARTVDAAGKVVLPGFVDCHTHLIFGGSRVEEYAARVAGQDIGALARAGVPVGIAGTVEQTRTLSVEELVAQATPLVRPSGVQTNDSSSVWQDRLHRPEGRVGPAAGDAPIGLRPPGARKHPARSFVGSFVVNPKNLRKT